MGRPLYRHVIAVLVLLHVVSVAVSSLPSVRGGLSPALMKEPAVQLELRQWIKGLAAIGVELTTDELQAAVTRVGHAYSDVRDVLVWPFRPYHRYLGTGQTWNLFTSAHRLPSRLEIDVEVAGAFSPLYRARSAELTWNRSQLDDVRLRKAIYLMSWHRGVHVYRTFTEWVAREVAKDFPDATRVRVRYWRYQTPSPEEVRGGAALEGRYVRTRVLNLENYR